MKLEKYKATKNHNNKNTSCKLKFQLLDAEVLHLHYIGFLTHHGLSRGLATKPLLGYAEYGPAFPGGYL